MKTPAARIIPGPGKSPHIDNLRPISLTSCIGKVLERIVLKRLYQHLEDTGHMQNSMYIFCQHINTQDALFQLKEEITAPATRRTPRAILAVDLQGAFDNVTHAAILGRVNQTGCGERTYRKTAYFFTDRRPEDGSDITSERDITSKREITSKRIELGSRDTP